MENRTIRENNVFATAFGENPIYSDQYHERLNSILIPQWCDCGRNPTDCVYCMSKRAKRVHLNNLSILCREFWSLQGENRVNRLQCFSKICHYYHQYKYSIGAWTRSFSRVYLYVYDIIDKPRTARRIEDNLLRLHVNRSYCLIEQVEMTPEMTI